MQYAVWSVITAAHVPTRQKITPNIKMHSMEPQDNNLNQKYYRNPLFKGFKIMLYVVLDIETPFIYLKPKNN